MPAKLPRSAAPPSLRRSTFAAHEAGPPAPLDPRPAPPPDRRPLTALAASASLGAAAVHAAVLPEHADWAPGAAFFGAIAAYQLTWGVILLLRPVRSAYLWTGAAVNVAAVVVWLQSRLAGIPFGPHKGEPEPFARTDVLAAVLEITIALAALAIMLRPRPTRAPRRRLAIGTATASMAALSAFALSGAAGHAHAPGEEHPAGPHGIHTHVVPTAPTNADLTVPRAPAARKVTAASAKNAGSRKATSKKPVSKKPLVRPSVPAPAPAPDRHDGDGHVH